MPHTRRYRNAVHYLQSKLSAQGALTRATRNLKDAYAQIAACNPSVRLLEEAHADIEIALREARAMANLDDAAITSRTA